LTVPMLSVFSFIISVLHLLGLHLFYYSFALVCFEPGDDDDDDDYHCTVITFI